MIHEVTFKEETENRKHCTPIIIASTYCMHNLQLGVAIRVRVSSSCHVKS